MIYTIFIITYTIAIPAFTPKRVELMPVVRTSVELNYSCLIVSVKVYITWLVYYNITL